YELLSLLGAVGLGAWLLAADAGTALRRTWMAMTVAWTVVAIVPHTQLLAEYMRHPPAGAKQMIIRALQARGARYAVADYWIAYSIVFLTNERIIAGSSDFIRIQEYQRILREHAAE